MNTITINNKKFIKSLSNEEIQARIVDVAKQIDEEWKGERPIFLCVLNGAFVFAADLVRKINLECDVSFVKLASYSGLSSTGHIREIMGLNIDVTNRVIIIVEDIVETGLTMSHMIETLNAQNPKAIRVATLLTKPERLKVEVPLNYVAFRIPNDFIVGYGLDYDGLGRNLPDIYTLANEQK